MHDIGSIQGLYLKPKVCRIIAFWAIFDGFGLLFTYFWGPGIPLLSLGIVFACEAFRGSIHYRPGNILSARALRVKGLGFRV